MEVASMADYESLRRRHFTYAMAQLDEHVAHLAWSRERIVAERDLRLRQLLKIARERSPWYHDRLAHIDVEMFSASQLSRLAPMTKNDLLRHFDHIVSDHRLSLGLVEAHLEQLKSDSYLLDEFHAIASGGSSGQRGVYVYDWAGWATYYLSAARHIASDRLHDPVLAAAPRVEAVIAADKPTHSSSALFQTFSNPAFRSVRIPISLQMSEIVARLNDLRPTALRGYPSALDLLGFEARAGRLRIAPLRLRCVGEAILPEVRDRLERTWRAPVHSQWVASETGTLGYSCPRGRGLHLNDDLVIVEPADGEGRPVPPGQVSAKAYVTNLYNTVLPLIRFEVTDEVTVLEGACPCRSGHTWIDDVHGRLDDTLTYPGGVTVHPFVIRSPLGRQRNIAEYQVHQTVRGVKILFRPAGEVDLQALHAELVAGLAAAGLSHAEVVLIPFAHIPLQGTGKLRRFVPLAG
jgi:phenylacetate-coenzyme A ligase PaaK-like adenylate-forming protein